MAAVVMLVALRLSLGCHFLYEGVWKIMNPDFSAEGFLLQAKGPATPLFHAMIPDMDGRERLKIEPVVDTDALVARWQKTRDDAVAAVAKPYRDQLAAFEEKRKASEDGKLSKDDQKTVQNLKSTISKIAAAFEPTTPILWAYEDRLEAFVDENDSAMLAGYDGESWKPAPEDVRAWLAGINEIQNEYFAALKQFVEKDKDTLKTVARVLDKAPPVYNEKVADDKLLSGFQLRDAKDHEVLRIAEAIRAEKFYRPWHELKERVVVDYGLTPEQAGEAEVIYRQYKGAVRTILAENQQDIAAHFAAVDRFEAKLNDGNQGAAHQIERNYDREQELQAEVNVWLNGLAATDDGYRQALTDLLTVDQAGRGDLPRRWTQMDLINFAVTYGLTAIGLCLILGLFTRPAALGGACFMLFVVLTQPAWPTIYPHDPPIVGHALLINKDFVEMIALFTLATTAAGRWGGLDFFVENTILRLCRSRKNQKDTQ